MEEIKIIENPISVEEIFAEETNTRMANLHSSSMKHYFKCPYKFKLSREHKVEQFKDAFTYGLLLEGYLFGFKDEPGYSEFEIRGLGINKDGTLSKAKGKKDETVYPIKERAEYLKKFFDLKNGTSFHKLEYDGNYKYGKLRGEIDFIGDCYVNIEILEKVFGEEANKFQLENLDPNYSEFSKRRLIVDLKNTSNIYYYWLPQKQLQFIQAIIYPYIWYKMTGEILDFLYFVVWDKSETIFKQLYFKTTEETFALAEKLIQEIENDLFLNPDCELGNCLGNGFGGGCEYIEHCVFGRSLVAENSFVDLLKLDSPLLRQIEPKNNFLENYVDNNNWE